MFCPIFNSERLVVHQPETGKKAAFPARAAQEHPVVHQPRANPTCSPTSPGTSEGPSTNNKDVPSQHHQHKDTLPDALCSLLPLCSSPCNEKQGNCSTAALGLGDAGLCAAGWRDGVMMDNAGVRSSVVAHCRHCPKNQQH